MPIQTMQGVVFAGNPFEVLVESVPLPTLQHDADAIVRITTSGICGSDLHVYRGVMGDGEVPFTIGHEAVGYVSEIGSAVTSLSVGDYVVIPDTPSSGTLELTPAGGAYFGNGAGLDGLQAEYAVVPFADTSLIPIPLSHNTTSDSLEQDYLTVGDIFATGWTGLSWSNFQAGDTVAVFGAGPVGLLAMHSAFIRGASRVYIVDHIESRLELAASQGAIPINFAISDPVAQILEHEPNGVMRCVEAVGMEALNSDLEIDEDIIISQMIEVTHFGGGIGIVGVYLATGDNPAAPLGSTLSPNATVAMNDFFGKRLSIRGGSVDPKLVAPELVRLIQKGEARPSFITSALIQIEEAPEYYRRFERHEETKVFIKF